MSTQNTRFRAMSWMRVLAFAFIIVYHFIFELEQKGNFDPEKGPLIQYSNSNLHIAIIGVSLFFMLSGAGLMLSSMRKWDLKDFYRRRFTKLLIPFYVVEIFTLVASLALKREWLSYFPFISKAKIIFNFLGMDGYFEQFFPTFSLHVGEWFLGALIMLYVLFPVFRFCMEKNRYVTILVATVYYVVLNYGNFFSISPWTNVFVKAYDFILGMFLITEIPGLMEKKSFRRASWLVSFLIILIGMGFKPVIPMPTAIVNLIYAVAIFIYFFSSDNIKLKDTVLDELIEKICALSYEVFLVHHIIIYYIGDIIEGQIMGHKQILALFVTEIIIMLAMAMLVRNIVNFINQKILKRIQ